MKILMLLPALLIASCNGNSQYIKETASPDLDEISGVTYTKGSDLLWAIEDQGNKNKIYGLDATGKAAKSITITNAVNNDWEDITTDAAGNMYIGDFGNNDNYRKNLAIYKVDNKSINSNRAETVSVINFSYPEQKEFPPKKSGRIFDCEAFFEHDGNFYLFTKNRSSKFDGSLSVYKVPNRAGTHSAQLMGSLNTCNLYKKCAITAAAISPDGKKVVLLSSDKIYVITGFTDDDVTSGTMEMYTLGHYSQKEGICFKDDNTLIIADEKDKKSSGKLYEVKLSELKTKS